jgi:hypothetical protein
MIQQLARFLRMSFFVFRALYAWPNPAAYSVVKFVVPFLQMSLFVYIARLTLGPEAVAYVAIGNAVVLVAFNTMMGVAITMSGEKWSGTLPRLTGVVNSSGLILTSRGVMHVLDGVLGAVIGLLYASLFFGVSFASTNIPVVNALHHVLNSLRTNQVPMSIARQLLEPGYVADQVVPAQTLTRQTVVAPVQGDTVVIDQPGNVYLPVQALILFRAVELELERSDNVHRFF